jgi:deoxyadenosine/deoxycytidine kinase
MIVAICGGIAVGKTTLVHLLGDLIPDSRVALEYPENNPYLADFYEDMQRWAFHSRIAMLAMFAARSVHQTNDVGTLITDRCFQELITFAELQRDKGNLTERDFRTFESLHAAFTELLPPNDIVVYLHCRPSVALERVRLRDRPFERRVDAGYLSAVSEQYQRWLGQLPASTEYFEYDTSEGIDGPSLATLITARAIRREPRVGEL